MKYTTTALFICLSASLISCEYFGSHFDSLGTIYSAVNNDFESPSLYTGNVQGRDPRQDRGPVVFPPPPRGAVEESSGVIVGASGYGFVPPASPARTKAIGRYPIYKPYRHRYFRPLSFY